MDNEKAMTLKPKMAYKGRMDRADSVWLIWSNKWGCWYRADSSGYTRDPMQAGLYTREQALEHYDGPGTPRRYRDTEPFPVSVLRSMATAAVAKAKADLAEAERRLVLACNRGEVRP